MENLGAAKKFVDKRLDFINNLLQYGNCSLTIEENKIYNPFSGCQSISCIRENERVLYTKKETSDIVTFVRELNELAIQIAASKESDLNEILSEFTYTYIEKELEPLWIKKFLTNLSFFDKKASKFEVRAFFASCFCASTQVRKYLGISLERLFVSWVKNESYFTAISTYLQNLKDYAYKFIVPRVMSAEEFNALYNPKANYYRIIVEGYSSPERKDYLDYSHEELLGVVKKANDEFSINKFFLNTSFNNYTTAAVILIAPDGRVLKADCKLSLNFRRLPYDYPIDHGNTSIILFAALFEKWIEYDGQNFIIDGEQNNTQRLLLNILGEYGVVTFLLCNYHEIGERESAIWLPASITDPQLKAIRNINEEIKNLCQDNHEFFMNNPLSFSYMSCIDEFNLDEKTEKNGFDGIFEYIESVYGPQL